MEPAVRLVPFGPQHLAAFAPLTHDPDVLRYTRFPDPPEETFPQAWLARYDAGRATGSKEAFAIEDAGSGALLGVALAVDADRATGAVELGYLVDPAARGRGIATAAVRRLTRWALDEGLTTITLLIDATNAGSRRVAERTGYVLTSIDEDAELRPGRRGALCRYDFADSSAASGAPQDSRSSGGGTL